MLFISLISSNTLIFVQQPNLKHRNLPFLVYKKMVAIYAAAPRSMDSIRCLKRHSNWNLCILRAVQHWINKITPNHNISTSTIRRCFIGTIVSELERLLLCFSIELCCCSMSSSTCLQVPAFYESVFILDIENEMQEEGMACLPCPHFMFKHLVDLLLVLLWPRYSGLQLLSTHN